MPAAMTNAGRIRRASTGVSMDPRMNPAEEGSIHSPAGLADLTQTTGPHSKLRTAATAYHAAIDDIIRDAGLAA
jgi:hypothetical protein